jgi:hypothetical protein
MLDRGQVQVGALVMGEGTPFMILDDFNPFVRNARADQTQPRAWGNGSWSGAEWLAEVTVPLRVRVRDPEDGTSGGWLAKHQQLAAAFAPVHEDVEMRFTLGGREFLMFGRPRLVEPDTTTIRRGYSITRAAFVANDPLIYSAEEHSETLALPVASGGLTLPLTVPIAISAAVASGQRPIVNAGSTPVGLRLRIDGPVMGPRVSLLASDGTSATLVFDLDLAAGQWLDVDTAARTVRLNGTASRRGKTIGDWPVLLPGAGEVSFGALTYNPLARLAVAWRDAWI